MSTDKGHVIWRGSYTSANRATEQTCAGVRLAASYMWLFWFQVTNSSDQECEHNPLSFSSLFWTPSLLSNRRQPFIHLHPIMLLSLSARNPRVSETVGISEQMWFIYWYWWMQDKLWHTGRSLWVTVCPICPDWKTFYGILSYVMISRHRVSL